MPTPRPCPPAAPRTRKKAALVSLLAVPITAVVAAFLAVSPSVSASTAGRVALPAEDETDATGPAAYTPAIRVLAVRAMSEKLGLSTADATARLAALGDRTLVATALERALGARAAGSYLDPASGQLVVNVTDAAVGQSVAVAGAKPRLVSRSMAQLRRVQDGLDASGAVPGTSWAIDAESNAVTVQISSVAEADPRTSGWVRALGDYGDAVRVQYTNAGFTTQSFLGGQAILNANGSGRCSSGFNAVRGEKSFVITAGHCTQAVREWTDGIQPIGASDVVQFPGTDFGTIAVDDPFAFDPRGAVNDNGHTQPITGSTAVPVGGLVCKTGSTTGTTCGTVLAYDTTVVYPEGTVTGLIETNLCTQPGDSGGALFAGDQAQGLVSGGTSGSCDQRRFVSFFQPINPVLQAVGLQLR